VRGGILVTGLKSGDINIVNGSKKNLSKKNHIRPKKIKCKGKDHHCS